MIYYSHICVSSIARAASQRNSNPISTGFDGVSNLTRQSWTAKLMYNNQVLARGVLLVYEYGLDKTRCTIGGKSSLCLPSMDWERL